MRPLVSAIAALIALAGCDPYVRGDGRYHEEARTLPPFAGVRVEDRLSVFVTAGREQGVTVSGDANLVRDSIETRLLADPVMVGTQSVPVLRVYVDLEEYAPTIPPRVVITVPTFAYVDASDHSRVEVRAAPASTFRVRAEGESVVTLFGPPGADELELDLDSAALDADTYPVSLASVELTGNATAELSCAGPVTGTASGTSVVDNRLGAGDCGVTLVDEASCLSPP